MAGDGLPTPVSKWATRSYASLPHTHRMWTIGNTERDYDAASNTVQMGARRAEYGPLQGEAESVAYAGMASSWTSAAEQISVSRKTSRTENMHRNAPIMLLSIVLAFAGAVQAKQNLCLDVSERQDAFSSAEDVAVRFTTGLIEKQPAEIRLSSLRPYGSPSVREKYASRLKEFVGMVESNGLQNAPSPGAPQRILKVFTTRSLSSSGPASYGYTAFDFMDVAFVDLLVQTNDGEESLYRILTIKDRDGLWYVHPFSDLSPLLSDGLDSEAPSTVESRRFNSSAN